ncbi:MAG TPA: NADH-quinone oxidoreductase subunit J [Chitinophagaceae bacterium]|jgi:NADH-quinone oxidoreductase subunit J|nr:NADH-quinone oxidoreductase subunit J [Chitinophagaceae bacterium]
MSASAIIFYIISAFILGAGILAMTTRKIFRSAIWLLFSLIGVAALYFWLQVEFIAAVQIVVYVGGIVVLIIFSIFLTQQSGVEMPKQSGKRILFSALAVLFGFGLTFLQIWKYNFQPTAKNFNWTVSKIGSQMLSTTTGGYALPFEVVSMLLLAAMIGCIVIAMKAPSATNGKAKEEEIEKLNQEPKEEIIITEISEV